LRKEFVRGKENSWNGAQKSIQSPRTAVCVCVSLGVIIVERLQMTPLAAHAPIESEACKKRTKGRAR
jgi:hypothetical protein